MIWDRIYDDFGDPYDTSIQQTSDGGYIIVNNLAVTDYNDNGEYINDILRLLMRKIDSLGNIVWDKIRIISINRGKQ